LRRRLHGRVRVTNHDRWFLSQLYRWFPSILQAVTIIRPETLVRWHRAGFRCYWRWKSRPLGGRPQIDTELRVLIRRMSMENPLWGARAFTGLSSIESSISAKRSRRFYQGTESADRRCRRRLSRPIFIERGYELPG